MGGADLRVIPAVTRLTVYRRPQVMRAGEDSPGWGPKLCVAGAAFKHEMLRIILSNFDEGQEELSSGIILEPSDSPMSIVILSAEPKWWTGLVGKHGLQDLLVL